MESQKFKGDEIELRYEESARPAMEQVGISLDQFWASAFDSAPFILNLYDDKRIPFAERVKRDAFVAFYQQVLLRFPFVGSFDSYLFILSAIFGSIQDIQFDIPSPGILFVDINSASSLDFDFIGRDVDGNIFEITDHSSNVLSFRGIAGIETSAELELLFSEIMPAGISPHISLSFYSRYNFVGADAVGGLDDIIDHLGNNIIFVETGA